MTLKPEEYEILQKELHNKVIFRNNNVYLTSNPEEVKRFKDSLKTKYDWIIDGLNLGHKYIVDAQKDHDAYTFTATVKQQSKMVWTFKRLNCIWYPNLIKNLTYICLL